MRKPLLAVLIAGGCAIGFVSWRVATEPGRRYSECLDLIRSHEGRKGREWRPADAAVLWGHVLWFRDRDPRALGRWIRGSILDGVERSEAVTLAVAILRYDGFMAGAGSRYLTETLPSPVYPGDESFQAEPFQLASAILEDAVAVQSLVGSAKAADRRAFVALMFGISSAPPHAWKALLRRAEVEADVDTRLWALQILPSGLPEAELRPLLRRLALDPAPAVRLAGLSGLAQRGDAQAGREALLLAAHEDPRFLEEHRDFPIQDLFRALYDGKIFDAGRPWLAEGMPVLDGEIWEFAEAVGDALERAAVGEATAPFPVRD